jgi:hypothetical protein
MKHSPSRKGNVLFARERSWPAQRVYSPLTLATTVRGKHTDYAKKISLYHFTVFCPLVVTVRCLLFNNSTQNYAQLWLPKNTKENISIFLHAQNTTALQPNVFSIGINRLLVNKQRKVGLSNRKPLPSSIKSLKKFPATNHYPQPNKYSPWHSIQTPYDPFSCFLPSSSRSSKWALTFSFPYKNTVRISLLPPTTTHPVHLFFLDMITPVIPVVLQIIKLHVMPFF